MRSVGRAFCRSYASHARTPPTRKEIQEMTELAKKESRARTAPMAVRERIAARGIDTSTHEKLTPSEFTAYQRALVLGELMDKNGQEPTAAEWLERLNQKRNRYVVFESSSKRMGRKRWMRWVKRSIYQISFSDSYEISHLQTNHTTPSKPRFVFLSQ